MAYTPTTWASGDTITSTKLNKIEQGIANGGGVFLVNAIYDSGLDNVRLDKTAGEIWSALQTSIVVIHNNNNNQMSGNECYNPITQGCRNSKDGYDFRMSSTTEYYTAYSSTDYPEWNDIK